MICRGSVLCLFWQDFSSLKADNQPSNYVVPKKVDLLLAGATVVLKRKNCLCMLRFVLVWWESFTHSLTTTSWWCQVKFFSQCHPQNHKGFLRKCSGPEFSIPKGGACPTHISLLGCVSLWQTPFAYQQRCTYWGDIYALFAKHIKPWTDSPTPFRIQLPVWQISVFSEMRRCEQGLKTVVWHVVRFHGTPSVHWLIIYLACYR